MSIMKEFIEYIVKNLVDSPDEEVEGGEYGAEVLINQRKQGFSLTIQVELREDDVNLVIIYATHILIRNMVEATDSTTTEESADVGEIQSGGINTTLLDILSRVFAIVQIAGSLDNVVPELG